LTVAARDLPTLLAAAPDTLTVAASDL